MLFHCCQFDADEFTGTKEVFLHADLTWDHFLIGKRNDTPFVSGVIDLADCRVDHAEYDIPATAAFIFKNEPSSLHTPGDFAGLARTVYAFA